MRAFLIVILMTVFSSPAHGQRLCMGRDNLVTQLYIQAQEQPVAIALTAAGAVLEVLTNEDGSTWTIIATISSGLGCVVGTGVHWRPVEPPKGPVL